MQNTLHSLGYSALSAPLYIIPILIHKSSKDIKPYKKINIVFIIRYKIKVLYAILDNYI